MNVGDFRANWPKIQRGFAALSVERRTEISRIGGRSVPAAKRGFAQNRELAIAAGRKGGKTRAANAEKQHEGKA